MHVLNMCYTSQSIGRCVTMNDHTYSTYCIHVRIVPQDMYMYIHMYVLYICTYSTTWLVSTCTG